MAIQNAYALYTQGSPLHGRYVRQRPLNEGSFGIVSVAKDLQSDKLVAVKYNTGRLADFASYSPSPAHHTRSVSLTSKTKSIVSNATYSNTQRSQHDVSQSIVVRETDHEIAMLLKVGQHPNITQLLDYFGTFLVFDYAPRGDLHDAIHLGIAPVNTRDVVNVAMQLINAVDHCHSVGVYHRDIKPENILITENWTIQLTDFGLATEKLVCTDFDVGSERYMAPELLEHSGSENYLADKVDIWSVGICILNIVFGKSPFKSASSSDKLFLSFANNREALMEIFPSMSYDLFSVMMNSLTIDPANRDLNAIKSSLSTIGVLTYDYEFDYDEDKPHIDEVIEESKPSDEEDEVHTPSPDWHNHSLVQPVEIAPQPKKYEPPRRIYVDLEEDHQRRRRLNLNARKPIRVSDAPVERTETGLDFDRRDFFTPKADLVDYMERANRKKRDLQVKGTYPACNQRYSYSNCNKSITAWQTRRRRFSYNKESQWNSHHHSGQRKHSSRMRHSFNRRSGSNRRPLSAGALPKVKPRTSFGPKCVDGKYVPPNARGQYESVFSEDEEEEEDPIFSFDKPALSLSRGMKKLRVCDSSRETSLGTNSTTESAYEKYIPPHHRRHSVTFHFRAPMVSHTVAPAAPSTGTQNLAQGILKRQLPVSSDKKQVRILTPVSSSAPDSTNWFSLKDRLEAEEGENAGNVLIDDDDDDDYLFSIDEDHGSRGGLDFA